MPSIENQTLSKLYYSIGEVAEMFQVNASLLRFWEKEFNLIVSKKNKKGNRLFSVKEIEQIKRIYHFVKVEGYTLDGAKKALKQKSTPSIPRATTNVLTDNQSNLVLKTDHSDLIARLEGIKVKLLQLPIQTPALNQSFTQVPPESTPQQAVNPVKPITKKAVEKQKPASDMPTLFDF